MMTGGMGPARTHRARFRRNARPDSGSSAGGGAGGRFGIALDGRNARRFVDSIGRASYSRDDVDRIMTGLYGMTVDELARRLRSGGNLPPRLRSRGVGRV